MPEDALEVVGEPHLYERVSDDGARVSRHRGCAICMTRVYNTNTARPGLAVIRAGKLDRSDQLAIVAHIWAKRNLRSIDIPKGVPTWTEAAPPAAIMAVMMK